MSELYFSLGTMSGFTAIELADKKEGYVNPLRELFQNSLDASRDANKENCEINIYIETISKNQIPHIDDYERVLEKAINTAKQQESYNENSQQRVRPIKAALKQDKLQALMFSDNGTGMEKKKMDAILAGGVSIKGGDGSGGSFGVGNLSSYSLSSLRYVLYATKYEDENGAIKSLFTGSPILAGYRETDAQRGSRGRIIQQKPVNEKNPDFVYLEKFPDFIKPKMNKIDTGTVVAILGLSENWDNEAEYAIVSNFFHGIVHGALEIKIHRGGQEPKFINIDEVESIIKSKKDVKRARGENILSGKSVYQALQAVLTDQQEITLSNSDKVHVCIKTDKETDPAIVLIRNGMLIARHDSMLSRDMDGLRKTSDFEPFTAVIDVGTDAPKLLKLVKGAESPYHNKLQAKILAHNDEKRLKRLFKELSEEIKKHLVQIDRATFDLPLFPIPDKATPRDSSGNKSSGQNNKAKPQAKPKRPPKEKESEKGKGKGKNRPKPVVISRNLESKNAVRYTDKAGKWEVKLRIVPNKMDANDDVYLSMCLAEDNDQEEAKTYLDFAGIKMNGQSIEMPEKNKRQIKLGRLKQSNQYNIIAEVEKPSEIGNMKVALLPILGLKQRRSGEE